ncbi:glycosyl hydrolase family 95 catalytic domain-containing protein [Porphyromonas pogonae]|uniref:glycosyl hydrolase family 95 catalytic domain-containing protein n=1 Tax=Porphyromonas pogonae TaxID=867595 RepID=UPI002E767E9A|nr:glycoside hydrolase N-terminal domain-containing protein [Porphyromonas pogonae]
MKNIVRIIQGLVIFMTVSFFSTAQEHLGYYFDKPGKDINDQIPLGNGRQGMMSDGGITNTLITLNESSMWSGSIDPSAFNLSAVKHLEKIRQLLFHGKNKVAEDLMYNTFVCGGKGSALGSGARAPYGSYEVGAFLNIQSSPMIHSVSSYRRSLDIMKGISKETIDVNGKLYRERVLFSSYNKDVNIIHIHNSTQALSDTIKIGLSRPERGGQIIEDNKLILSGALNDGYGREGLRYTIITTAKLPQGGKIINSKNYIAIVNAPEITLYTAHNTNYYNKQTNLLNLGKTQINQAQKISFRNLQLEHEKIFGELMNRVQVDIQGSMSHMKEDPIDIRLSKYNQNPSADPGLAALYMQFGRYLLISSARANALPPNLQGLWTTTIQAPWNGDYHLNINLQMNYWPAEKGNYTESVVSLIRWIEGIVPSGEKTARCFYNANGWVTHILGNLWQFTAPGEHPSWGATNTGAAWLCRHLYDHYLYGRDISYLKRIYPIMKKAALFFNDVLVKDPRNGYFVNAPTTSPENSFITLEGDQASVCAGSTMDNQIIRELFHNTIEAGKILNTPDKNFRDLLASKLTQIKPTTIGKDGRIMEWMQDYTEAEPNHRHVSHLYGLFPGNEITPEKTPDLSTAAKLTLEKRGDSSTGWSMAWKINFYARLGDGEKALSLLNMLLRPAQKLDPQTGKVLEVRGGTLPNLFCTHPPFQIDGNFGGSSGIMEMLLSSETGYIKPLPALPKAWQKGEIEGLRVIGNAECDLHWDQTQPCVLKSLKIRAQSAYTHKVLLPDHCYRYRILINGKQIKQLQGKQREIAIPMKEGQIAEILAP